jgi:beta-1,4-mannosyl-glycoprotein beta-1,4-N-acetylglucosaminyltransferase
VEEAGVIFDCFTFYNELELLRVRLHELSPVVDRFVLVEATATHQGKPKPLYYRDNARQFAEFSDKLIHVVIDFPAYTKNKFARTRNQTWAREYHQRDQIARGLTMAGANDLIIVSDVDEIVSADKLRQAIRSRPPHALTIFDMPTHPYYVNRRAKYNAGWLRACPRMIEFSRFQSPQHLRMTKPFTSKRLRGTLIGGLLTGLYNRVICGVHGPLFIVANGGWHFSSIGGWENYRNKVEAYAHAEDKEKEIFKKKSAFLSNIAAETVAVDEAELPAFMREHRDVFPFFG